MQQAITRKQQPSPKTSCKDPKVIMAYECKAAKLLSTLNAKCCSKYAGITSLRTEHKAYKSPRSICITNMHKECYIKCAN